MSKEGKSSNVLLYFVNRLETISIIGNICLGFTRLLQSPSRITNAYAIVRVTLVAVGQQLSARSGCGDRQRMINTPRAKRKSFDEFKD